MEDRSKDAAGKSVPAQLQPTVFGDEHQGLVGIVQPHVQSFDELFVDTLPSIVTGLPPVEVVDTKGVHMRAKIVQVELGRPDVGEATGRTVKALPANVSLCALPRPPDPRPVCVCRPAPETRRVRRRGASLLPAHAAIYIIQILLLRLRSIHRR